MRYFLFLLLMLSAGLAHAQAPAAQETPNFCGTDIPLPAGCVADNKYGLRCDKYELQWAYFNYPQLNPVVEAVLKQEKKKHKGMEQRPLDGFILDQPAKGYHLSYPTDKGMAYQLLFYGVAKGQPLLVQLTMEVDPEKTADLPEVAQQIVHLTR
ncbi:hypothetical protein EJV47_06465 [Hymenobacter gummosus]|uniref:DUF1795 domain-containing protein n=1 Tax=Hymenobacter gummosus TaxID=1776032 RepID=A0A431U5Y1_9BACT|nr:hypothetical protein [Hymenobacter gummosus]RTQ51443.1 hypothetical protein EJV47_06465 [Hymenobacter gummosus]